MYRDGDIVAKGEVVEHVGSEEQESAQRQSSQWNSTLLEEERWTVGREVSWPCDESCYNELDESDKESFDLIVKSRQPAAT